jgi:carnitine O-acetyltransferase
MTQNSQHIIVMVRNVPYKLDIMKNGVLMSHMDLEHILYTILEDSHSKKTSPAVNCLTALPRNQWASLYTELQTVKINQTSLKEIESSLFVVCLDDLSNEKNTGDYFKQVAYNDNYNRWFDKPLQLIVSSTARVGLHCERSLANDKAISILTGFLLYYDKVLSKVHHGQAKLHWTPLSWNVTSSIEKSIQNAKKFLTGKMAGLKYSVFDYEVIGLKYIQEVAKVQNVDAFIQVAVQLAMKRLFNVKNVSVKSLVNVNKESIPVEITSTELDAFCDAFDNEEVPVSLD